MAKEYRYPAPLQKTRSGVLILIAKAVVRSPAKIALKTVMANPQAYAENVRAMGKCP
jgi:hypothetical protein